MFTVVINMPKIIEAVYENGVFKPIGKVDVKEDEKVRIEIKKDIFGILKDWKIDTQKLKDELREIHGYTLSLKFLKEMKS